MCSISFFPSTSTQNMCDHNILKFSKIWWIFQMCFRFVKRPSFLFRYQKMYLSYNKAKSILFSYVTYNHSILTLNLTKSYSIYSIYIRLHLGILCWFHHTSDTCIFTLARTTLVKHLHINVHTLMYFFPFLPELKLMKIIVIENLTMILSKQRVAKAL